MWEQMQLIGNQYPWFFSGFAFLLGSCVGSFLNVCIYRIPLDESVIAPGSHCACGKPIAWYDNLPILSWFLLRGRARCCGRRFSPRYPFVELLTGLWFLACWQLRSPQVALCGMVFGSMLIAATFIDFDHLIIPDRFSIGGAISGVLLSLLVPSLHGYLPGGELFFIDSLRSGIVSVVGALVGSSMLYWVKTLAEVALQRDAMGEGDLKFLGAIGAFCGWQGALFSIFGGAVIGCIGYFGIRFAQIVLPSREGSSEPLRHDTEASADEGREEEEALPIFGVEIPFGPMLAFASMLYFVYLHPWVDGYFATVKSVLFGF